MWRRTTVLRISIALAAIWALALSGLFIARSLKPSPQKVAALLEKHELADLSVEDSAAPTGAEAGRRAAAIAEVSREVNRLDFNQRRELRETGGIDRFFMRLSLEEKKQFLEATLPRGFEEMMRAFNAMEPQQRQRMVDQVLSDLDEEEASGRAPTAEENPELAKKIAEAGMEAYYENASADVKLDLAPVIEQLQERLQNMRR